MLRKCSDDWDAVYDECSCYLCNEDKLHDKFPLWSDYLKNKGTGVKTKLPTFNIVKMLRFYKMGLFFVAILGIYLGISGLYLIMIEKNYLAGISLFLAALLISPPPIGISNMVVRHFNVELSMALKLGLTVMCLFIAWMTM